MDYGLLTLLPALVVIISAIILKRTVEPLLLGCLLSYIIIDGIHFGNSMLKGFFDVLTNADNLWLIIVCGLFGTLINLLKDAGGTNAIANALSSFCNTQKRTLLVSWLIGIIIFIDDYMNIMTISSCMRDTSDRCKIPREALAYVIDTTGASMCVLLPFSTWAVFYGDAFYNETAVQELGYSSAIQTYMHIIPFAFYAIAAVVVVPLFICGIIPRIGRMKFAYQRMDALTESENTSEIKTSIEINCVNERAGRIIDFVIPIALMIIITIIREDILVAMIISITACGLMYVPRHLMSFGKFCDSAIKGFAQMIPSLLIIIAAFFMREASTSIGLSRYVVTHSITYMGAGIFPLMAFVIVSCLAFVTGSNWGIPAVCVSIIIPLASACGANLILVMAAIVSGGVFSSHACFYSDATVMTSSVCEIDNMDHALSQLPYALIGFALSCVAFLIAGLVW